MRSICEWRKTFIFPDYYSVSEYGDVRSERNGKILTPAIDKYGYFYYVLCVDGDRRTVKAHRLVAMAFIPNPQNKPDCDNLAKCVLDALNNVAYDDDKQVVELYVEKHWSDDPRVEVTLKEL